jgi:hypothetical protein
MIYHWANRWQIPPAALTELRELLGALDYDPSVLPGESEAAVQSRVRVEATVKGARLWRNNVGAVGAIRYGLANDSARVNAVLKSSDLIGIKPMLITDRHVGQIVGQFIARECKPTRWRYRGTKRERAQLAFLELVFLMGGDARFVTKEGTL